MDLANKMAMVHADEFKIEITISIPLNTEAMAALLSQQRKHLTYVFTYKGGKIKNAGAKA